MICQDCLRAGIINSQAKYEDAAEDHAKCSDKGCVCQHKTGHGLIVTKGSRVPLMQIQSP
jgi:hypothetical protein